MAATGIWLNPPVFAKTTEAEEQAVYEELDMDDLDMFDDPVEAADEELEVEHDVTL